MARRISALDGLRGLAVLLVVLRHAVHNDVFGEAAVLPWPLQHVAWNGWIGVDLFFVLSGFLISLPFFRSSVPGAADRPRWREYLLRRSLRILPAYWVVLLVTALGLVPLFTVDPANLPWRVAYHLVMLQDYLGHQIVPVFWSLGVEEKFYLLTPLVVPAIARLRSPRRQVLAIAGIAAIAPALRLLTWIAAGPPADYPTQFALFRSPFHACIDGLAWGGLLAWLHTALPGWAAVARARWATRAGCALLLGALLSPELPRTLPTVVLWPLAVGAVMFLLVAGAVEGAPAGAWSWPPARWLGRVSYSVYLVHYPAIPGAVALARWASGDSGAPPWPLFLAFYLALTALSAQLLHFAVERPFLALKDRLAPQRTEPRAVQLASPTVTAPRSLSNA
jgi:peptidoglycan/LPS O-acetylase OafA/YrhL